MERSDIKILLVDDREDNLFSMETVLGRDNYQFRKARSGNEALKILLKEIDFTLILMDVQMPGLNGFETASLIYQREKLQHIPIIFITANDYNEEYVFQGYEAGAVDYIYKPINPELLRAKVSVFVELYQKNHLLLRHEKELQEINNKLEERVKDRTQELEQKNCELEYKNQELKKVNDDLDSFVYAASHDLKAPISNIEGLLETLVDSMNEDFLKDEGVKVIFDMMKESISKFKNTINDLTEITKIQKNIDGDLDSVDILDIIEDVKIGIRELINKSKARIQVTTFGSTKINFSRKNLNSIVYNLISNGIKYQSPERLPEINIEIRELEKYIKLTVSDNGIGFKPENKEKIFTMFKRLHHHVEGSGVGLYIVKRILQNCGGSIDADSVPGKGSTFTVLFQLDYENAQSNESDVKIFEN